MDVVHVASEMMPFSKTGGLADVAAALPAAQARLGAKVSVITPLYHPDRVPADRYSEFARPLSVTFAGREFTTRVLAGVEASGVQVFHLDEPALFQRAGLYGENGIDYGDNHLRFAFLAHAALELMRRTNLKPDVIHAHDWQAALVPLLLATRYGRWVSSVQTIHNLGYQGVFPASALAEIGIPKSLFTPHGVEFYGQVNFLKAGLVSADRITTVSPSYAEEIQTIALGHGLDGVLRERADVLHGILNGLDVEVWDPASDPYLDATYDAEDLQGKRRCRESLVKHFGLGSSASERPLIGIVSRFVDQKGFRLVFDAMDELLARDLCLVVLGSGDPRYEEAFWALAARNPERIGVHVGYDEGLAHRIEAGSDLFLMPSRYEPCGLNQLISMRYGTLPIVHSTGGLKDSVRDSRQGDDATGFTFAPHTSVALLEAVDRALALLKNPRGLASMRYQAMTQELGWSRPAKKVLELYTDLIENR